MGDTDGSGSIEVDELKKGLRANKSLMRMVVKTDTAMHLGLLGEVGYITKLDFENYVVMLCKDLVKASEAASRRKKGILKQAERMFKVLDKDQSDTVDTEEIVAAMKEGGSFARMMRQLPDGFKPKDIAPSGFVTLKKFK